jgi:hypothetical protein
VSTVLAGYARGMSNPERTSEGVVEKAKEALGAASDHKRPAREGRVRAERDAERERLENRVRADQRAAQIESARDDLP